MNIEEIEKKLKECFKNAQKEEKEGRKHKGLLVIDPDYGTAKVYLQKAKTELDLCDLYKQKGLDYKIQEEWFYTLYYCALAILAKCGIETRSQRYTALFLQYIQEKGLINYDKEFIEKIGVFSEKGKESEVDRREEARYGPAIKIEKVIERYDEMMNTCKRAIFQCEEIIYSSKLFQLPKELLG